MRKHDTGEYAAPRGADSVGGTAAIEGRWLVSSAAFERIEIVEANSRSVDDLAPLFDAYRVFYEQDSDVEAVREFLVGRLQSREAMVFLAFGVSGDEQVPLGFTLLYPSFSSVSMKRLWILNDLFVAPEGRRQGVGRRLIERARMLAVATQAKGLILETAIDNVAAQALYDACGFVKDTEFFRYALLV